MKVLRIFSTDGVLLVYTLINLEGDNFSLLTSLPIHLPVIGVSITDPDEKKEDSEDLDV